MPKIIYRIILLSFVLLSLNPFLSPRKIEASIEACNVSVDPHQIQASSQASFYFTVRNFDQNPISWIKITRPSAKFSIVEPVSTGAWSASTTSSSMTLTGDVIQPNFSADFEIKVSTNDQVSASADWIVQVSDDLDGANPFSCSGSLDTEITCGGSDCIGPVISNIALSNLTTSSITISWKTNEAATSRLDYGTTASYGQFKNNSSLVLTHSLSLTGLSSDRSYHFKITSADSVNNSTETGDNTFLTPKLSSSSSAGEGVAEENNSLGSKKKDLVKKESVPPTVSVKTDFSKPFKKGPEIEGTARDNAGVFLVEYSTDGGSNWLPADKMEDREAKKVDFSFTPVNLEEGNYRVVVQATDTSGNATLSKEEILVIDRLDPTVGGSVISLGPQILLPDRNGLTRTIVGLDQKVTLSALGGATTIEIGTKNQSLKEAKSQLFSLTRSSQTGLWKGVMNFTSPGLYPLVVEAVDGAGKRTKREIGQVLVIASGKVEETQAPNLGVLPTPIAEARVTALYFEESSNSWVVWDGESYGQANPEKTDSEGKYQLFLPAGKYYLKVEANGYQTLISNIFTLDKATPVVEKISLKKALRIGFGDFSFFLPSFSVQKIDISTKLEDLGVSNLTEKLVDKDLPSLDLEDTNSKVSNLLENLGKPTLISFVSTWAPSSQEQFSALQSLQASADINIVPVAEGENLSKIKAFKAISGSKLTFLVDPDGLSVEKFAFASLPTHYVVDRKGIIKKVLVGVLSKEDILENLGSLK
ncbi:MAG: redoxin domain-containing protein [bacterium]|nr:redoxin domain-containing protein [bacterium]